MITFTIDKLTNCLVENATGDVFQTEAYKITNRKAINHLNKKNGWHINWSALPASTDIYAITIKDSTEIEGIIAVENDYNAQALYIVWACTAPHNNKWEYGTQKYEGVGGHLFAIAAEESEKRGFEGFLVGEAMDKDIYKHYITNYHAAPLPPINNPYRFMVSDSASKGIRKEYDYEWKDDKS